MNLTFIFQLLVIGCAVNALPSYDRKHLKTLVTHPNASQKHSVIPTPTDILIVIQKTNKICNAMNQIKNFISKADFSEQKHVKLGVAILDGNILTLVISMTVIFLHRLPHKLSFQESVENVKAKFADIQCNGRFNICKLTLKTLTGISDGRFNSTETKTKGLDNASFWRKGKTIKDVILITHQFNQKR